MQETTLGVLKNHLPIGISDRPKRDFTFRNWTLEQEKKISEFRKANRSHGAFVNKVLCYMLESLAGEDFNTADDGRKQLMLNQMSLMDVLYMYIYLRYDQLDSGIRLHVTCPACGKVNKDFVADMNGLDVKTIDGKDAPLQELVLKKPFELEKTKVEIIKVRRTPWDAMEKATDEVTTNNGKMMELIFDHSIVGINNEEGFTDIQALLKNLHKKDFERLSALMVKHNAGPSLIVHDNCKFCGSEFYQQLDWSYDSFFGASSLPVE